MAAVPDLRWCRPRPSDGLGTDSVNTSEHGGTPPAPLTRHDAGSTPSAAHPCPVSHGPGADSFVSLLGRMGEGREDGRMSRYERYDVTDEQWEGLAQVVPLRGRNEWPSRVDHRTIPRDGLDAAPGAEVEQRRMVVLRVQVFADAREVAEYLIAQVPVLLDLTSADAEVAKRILDFSSGVVFGLGCGMHRVDRNVFLLAPVGTEVDGLAAAAVPHS